MHTPKTSRIQSKINTQRACTQEKRFNGAGEMLSFRRKHMKRKKNAIMSSQYFVFKKTKSSAYLSKVIIPEL